VREEIKMEEDRTV